MFTGTCYQPGLGRNFDPCALGTIITVATCPDRATCLDTQQEPIGKGVVDAQGQFAVVTPRAQVVAPLVFQAALPGIDYRLLLNFGPIGAAAAGGAASSVQDQIPPDVTVNGALIDPVSEAGARVLDKVGLGMVADEKIQPTLDSVRAANTQTNFSAQTPSEAAANATGVALTNRGVQTAICASTSGSAAASQISGDGGAAFVALVAGPTFPAFVQVGDVNIAAQLEVINFSGAPENAGTMTVSQIRMTPACGTDAGFDCPSGFEDPNVFIVHGPAIGQQGTACDGMTFAIGAPDAITGQVSFTPTSGVVVLLPPDTGALNGCTIQFFVDVTGLPVHDAGPLPGASTLPSVFACGTASVDELTVPGIGESQVAVLLPTPVP